MRKRRKWPWVLLVLVVVLGGLGAVVAKVRAGKGAPVDPTLVARTSRGELEIAVVELGKIEPREKVAVKAKVAGHVEKILI